MVAPAESTSHDVHCAAMGVVSRRTYAEEVAFTVDEAVIEERAAYYGIAFDATAAVSGGRIGAGGLYQFDAMTAVEAGVLAARPISRALGNDQESRCGGSGRAPIRVTPFVTPGRVAARSAAKRPAYPIDNCGYFW